MGRECCEGTEGYSGHLRVGEFPELCGCVVGWLAGWGNGLVTG